MIKHKKLSLTILSRIFYPQEYSTGQTLTELSEVLTEKGVDVSVYAGPPVSFDRKSKFPKFINYKGIKVYRIKGASFSKNNLFGRIINDFTYIISMFFTLLFKKVESPLLVLTNPPLLGFIAVLIKKIKKIKFIYLIFDVYPDTAIRLRIIKKNGIIEKIWNNLNDLIFKNAEYVVVIGRDMKKIIINKFEAKNIEKRKIVYIPIWTDDRKFLNFNPKDNPLMKKFDLTNKFVVLYSGNLGKFHDIETIMSSASILDKKYDDIIFLFIGEGYKKEYAINFVNKHNLRNCIFSTFLPKRDYPYVLKLSDIAIVSLLPGQEGLSVPSKTFSYWAAGLPVIAIMSEHSEIGYIIKEYKAGFIVKPGNYLSVVNIIEKLYMNKEMIKKIGSRGEKLIKDDYNLNIISEKYIELINRLKEEKYE